MANDTEERSRIDQGYEEGAGAYRSLHEQEQQASFDRDFHELTSPDHMAKDGKRPDDSSDTSNALNNKEEIPYSAGTASESRAAKGLAGVKAVFSKNKPAFSIGGLLAAAITAIFIGGAGPLSFIVGPASSIFDTNDSVGPGMRRAFRAAFSDLHKTDPNSICAVNSKKIKCKGNRLSYKALNRLHKNGVVAIFDDGTKYDGKTKRGYPDRKNGIPKAYEIDGKRIDSRDLNNLLSRKGNFRMASKIVGVRGAFNLKQRGYVGKHTKSKLYNPLRILRQGGIADGAKKKLNKSERLAKYKTKLKSAMPSESRVNAIKTRATSKVEKNLGKYKKGGVAYLMSAGSCALVKAPKYLITATAAVQILQLAPIVVDTMLSPRDKMKASGHDYGEGINEHDLDTLGTVANERAPDESGKIGSMLDSPYLLAAMGINKAILPISKYAPGINAIKNPLIKAGLTVSEQPVVSATCNVILNPITMWTAAAVDLAATAIIAGATAGIGVIVKSLLTQVVVTLTASAIIGILTGLLADAAVQALTDDEKIVNATGLELGHVVGTSAMVFFSAAGMSRLLPAMSQSQFSKLGDALKEDQEIERQTEIASLSPFDTSSKYTFMGSIVNYMQTASLQRGHLGIHIPSVIASALSPSLMFSTAGAVNSPGYNLDNCDPKNGYAEVFDINGDTPDRTPLVNFAGMPCTGYTSDMPLSEAIEILEGEGWIDPEVESDRDDLLIDELMPNDTDDGYEKGIGFIKKDNPLYDFVFSCGNPDLGEHIENASGCILPSPETQSGGGATDLKMCDEDITTNCVPKPEPGEGEDPIEEEPNEDFATANGVKNPKAFEAISAFLLQYQTMQSINGEDDGPVTEYTGPTEKGSNPSAGEVGGGGGGDTGGGTGGGGSVVGSAGSFSDPNIACPANTTDTGTIKTRYSGPLVKSPYPTIRLCQITSIGGNPRINAASAEQYQKMGEAAKSAGINLYSNSSFRYADSCGGSGAHGCAPPGLSNHQLGIAIDFSLTDGRKASQGMPRRCQARVTSKDPKWIWLRDNAPKYGITQLDYENWHWDTSAGPNNCK